jgi:WD40 repeat protein
LEFFDGGNKFVTCSADKTVKVWKWEGLELLHTLNVSPKPGVQDMQVGVTVTNEYIISLSLSGILNFWNLEGLSAESVAAPDFTQAGHRKNVIQVWYNEDKLISIDTEGRVLSFSNLSDIPAHKDLGKSVKQASFSSCGGFMAVSSSNKVFVYNTATFEQLAEIPADGFINKLFLVNQNKIAVVTNKNTFTIYENGEEAGVAKLGEEGISLDVSEDETTAYVGSNVSIPIFVGFDPFREEHSSRSTSRTTLSPSRARSETRSPVFRLPTATTWSPSEPETESSASTVTLRTRSFLPPSSTTETSSLVLFSPQMTPECSPPPTRPIFTCGTLRP